MKLASSGIYRLLERRRRARRKVERRIVGGDGEGRAVRERRVNGSVRRDSRVHELRILLEVGEQGVRQPFPPRHRLRVEERRHRVEGAEVGAELGLGDRGIGPRAAASGERRYEGAGKGGGCQDRLEHPAIIQPNPPPLFPRAPPAARSARPWRARPPAAPPRTPAPPPLPPASALKRTTTCTAAPPARTAPARTSAPGSSSRP